MKELANSKEIVELHVKRLKVALSRTLDVIKRAVYSSSSRPKDILFFACPIGTDKTELAKVIAESLFDNENARIRFDMSNYLQPQIDQKYQAYL